MNRRLVIMGLLGLVLVPAAQAKKRGSGSGRKSGGGKGGGNGGCGSKGGPGYRKPNGRCASWKD